jgi:hypothetical protein
MIAVSDLLAGVDVDKNSHWSLFSFRFPQCVFLRSGLKTKDEAALIDLEYEVASSEADRLNRSAKTQSA